MQIEANEATRAPLLFFAAISAIDAAAANDPPTAPPTDVRENAIEVIHAFEALTALRAENLDFDGDDSTDTWERLFEQLGAVLALIEGATGRHLERGFAEIAPDLLPRYVELAARAPSTMRAAMSRIEDWLDNRAADAALAEHGDKPSIPWEQVKAELGLG